MPDDIINLKKTIEDLQRKLKGFERIMSRAPTPHTIQGRTHRLIENDPANITINDIGEREINIVYNKATDKDYIVIRRGGVVKKVEIT